MAESSAPIKAGITTDGRVVFNTGIDQMGRKVTIWATPDSPGELDDKTKWALQPEDIP